jgi:radical SAM protein with 4Fe4S-binding SPASM domain
MNVGNLKREKFSDVWLNSGLFNELRDRDNLKGACGRCSYKFTCGGCRARANAYYEDIQYSDPGCVLAKKAGDA